MTSAYQEQCCSICELQHLTTIADEWCPECDEYLCSNCKTHHKLAKSSRRHKTVDISDLNELPSFVSDIKIECSEHLENYEYFCPKHEIPICVICAKEHTNCGNFTILRKLESMKTSPRMIKLEQNVKDILQNFEIFVQNRLSNLSNLKDQQVVCREKVKEMRLKINQQLDNLEKTVIGEIDSSYTKHKSEIEQIVDDLSARKMKIDTIEKNIEKIKDHATEIQIFLSIQDIQKDVKEEENQIIIIGRDKLEEIELSFLPASSSTSGTTLQSFGELKTNIKPADISFTKQEDSQAQLMMPVVNKQDIYQTLIAKTLALQTDLGVSNIKGCCGTEEGFILMSDRHLSRILVLASNGTTVCDIPLNQKPNDVAYTKKTILVSSFLSMTLTSIDFDTKQLIKTVETGHTCDALAVADDRILLHLCDVEFRIYNPNLLEVGKIPVRVSYAPYLCYFDEQIYFTKWNENAVYCYNMTGSLVWKFIHGDISSPHGITLDHLGNLFVCSSRSRDIILISRNGDQSRVLLRLPDIMTYPKALHYNKDTRQLIVSSSKCCKVIAFDLF